MAQAVGYSLFVILFAVAILVMWTKSGEKDWPVG